MNYLRPITLAMLLKSQDSPWLKWFDFLKPSVQKKPNTIIMHVGTNDMTQGVINISKVRIIIISIQELDNTGNLKLGFSNIIKTTEKDNSQ